MNRKHKNKPNPSPMANPAVMAKPMEIVKMMASENSDPNGSYTGVPKNKWEKPVQDADDL